MITHVAGMLLPESVILELGRAAKLERAEARDRAEEAAEDEMRRQVMAPQIHAEYARRMAEAQAIEHQAEAARAELVRQRQAQLDDLRTQLMLEGRQWRTPQQIADALRGLPS